MRGRVLSRPAPCPLPQPTPAHSTKGPRLSLAARRTRQTQPSTLSIFLSGAPAEGAGTSDWPRGSPQSLNFTGSARAEALSARNRNATAKKRITAKAPSSRKRTSCLGHKIVFSDGPGRGRSPVRRPVTGQRGRGRAEACPRPPPGPRSQTGGPGLLQTPPIRSAPPRGKRDPSSSGTPPLANAPPGLCGCVPASAMGAFLANQISLLPHLPIDVLEGRGFRGSRLPKPRR